jgi:hypothetical protein
LEKLSIEAQVSPAVISQAFRKGLEAGPADEAALTSYVGKMIDSQLTLSGARDRLTKLPPAYRPECLNVSPKAEEILRIVKGHADASMRGNGELAEGLKFLFHGPSGSGKTELAFFLAQSLGVELVHGRLSDILSPFVGRSESNLANLFGKAKALGGILLIDEIESCLARRAHRVNPQHVTNLTNEFLTCLDCHPGVFIGSTNMFSSLDPAAIRRFTFKVEFKPLTPKGRLILFDSFFLPISGERLSEPESKYLLSLPSLTPGDFSIVAEKAEWRENEARLNFSLLESLALEAAYRGEKSTEPKLAYTAEEDEPNSGEEGSGSPQRSVN